MSNLLRAEGVSYQVKGRSILSDIDLSFEKCDFFIRKISSRNAGN